MLDFTNAMAKIKETRRVLVVIDILEVIYRLSCFAKKMNIPTHSCHMRKTPYFLLIYSLSRFETNIHSPKRTNYKHIIFTECYIGMKPLISFLSLFSPILLFLNVKLGQLTLYYIFTAVP